MKPFFGPDRDETLELLRSDEASDHLPLTLGDGMPSYVIDTEDDRWVLFPLQLDDEAAERVGEQAIADSGLWSWEFLERGASIYATPSKAEFIRWLETWAWLGTGVPRAAPKSSEQVTAVELEFENLMNGDRTVFCWTRSPDDPALESLHAKRERGGAVTETSAQIPAHLWSEFVDVLRTHAAEESDDSDLDQTRPDLIVSQRLLREVEGVDESPAGRTVDGFAIDPSSYLSCQLRLAVASEGRIETHLEKGDARELHDFVLAFASDYGVEFD